MARGLLFTDCMGMFNSPDRYRGRVMLIHQTEAVCRATEKYFTDRGFIAFGCASPADALGEMLQTSYGKLDLLVMDSQTACNRGMDLLDRLRKHRPDFPILLWVVPDDPQLALKAYDSFVEDSEVDSEQEEEIDTESEYIR